MRLLRCKIELKHHRRCDQMICNAEQRQRWLPQREAIGQTFHANAGRSKGMSLRGDPVAGVCADNCQQLETRLGAVSMGVASAISTFCRNNMSLRVATGLDISRWVDPFHTSQAAEMVESEAPNGDSRCTIRTRSHRHMRRVNANGSVLLGRCGIGRPRSFHADCSVTSRRLHLTRESSKSASTEP